MPWTCASSPPGASNATSACSRPAAPTSSALPATWKHAAGPGPPSPGGCAPSPGSTSTPSKKSCSTTPRRFMSAVHAWIMSLMPPGCDRNELGALLVAAGLGMAAEHALISLLALNGLRVSEATGADIEALAVERGHRTLTITRKGGKVTMVPLAPRTARAVRPGHRRTMPRSDLPHPWRAAAGPARRRPDRPPGRSPRRDRQPSRPSHAQACLHHRRARMRACRCATSRKLPPTLILAPPCATTGPGHHWTGTPPISSPPTSPEPPANPQR